MAEWYFVTALTKCQEVPYNAHNILAKGLYKRVYEYFDELLCV